jgi:hypothetical protein
MPSACPAWRSVSSIENLRRPVHEVAVT